jgi:hypothetical protein
LNPLLAIPDCSRGPGVADVLLGPIGGRNRQSIEAIDVGAVWEINQPGTLAVDLPLDEAVRQVGDPAGLLGWWIDWPGIGTGAWSGKITRAAPDRLNGKLTLQATDHSYPLSKRLLPESNRVVTGSPGAVAAALIAAAQTEETLWLESVVWDEAGDGASSQLRGQNLLDELRQLAEDAGHEFAVTADRQFVWRERLGIDRTARVQLTEGVEIAGSTPDFDIGDLVNDLTVIPAAAAQSLVKRRREIEVASVAQIGPQQGELVTAASARPAALRTIGQTAVARSAAKGRTLSFDVVDVNGAFAAFVEGDVIRVVLPSLNFAGDVRVLQRGLVLSEMVLRCVGEAA